MIIGDTLTTPTRNMIAAMLTATHGDDVYGEDSSINNLQEKVAKLTGKESGLFCVSGTMSNQIALRTHLTQPPHSILCDHRAHVYTSEAGGLATLSQAMVVPVKPQNGVYLTLEDVVSHVWLGDDIHTAPTKVISLENTLHGTIMPIEEIKKISEFAKKHNIKMHLDGARIWNASIATGISLSDYCQYFDSVSLCLSKGLGAPIGSILVGKSEFTKKANWFKKQNGGGIRQAGILAAAANCAIEESWPKMVETHKKTKEVAKYFESIGITTTLPVETNFIFPDFEKVGISPETFYKYCEKYGIKSYAFRIAFHHQISDEAIELLKKVVVEAYEEAKSVPAVKKEGANSIYQ